MSRFVRALFVLFYVGCMSTNAGAFTGNLSNAIFVDAVTGSDGNPGTMAQPKATIPGALSIATSGKNVYVSKGAYYEAVQMVSGVSLYGQYDQASNWTPDPANTTIIKGNTNPVSFSNVSGETHFEGFLVDATNAAATQSSYAVRIDSSPGPIFIRYNTLMAGAGGPGLVGTNGVAGALVGTGANGINGFGGSCDNAGFAPGGVGGTSTCSGAGGNGGNGNYGQSNGTSGGNGAGGALGGSGGAYGSTGSPGGTGSPGANGTNGANAVASASAIGSVAAGFYMPVTAPSGGSGTNGNSGGGGGGGGQYGSFVIDGTGNGGGGGGAGGCGATQGGTSGEGGGGSFALFVSASVVTVDANYLVVRQAGTGGLGGNGATGSTGGSMGAGATVCTGEVGGGGNGGGGGKGGNSGVGAGGPGGPGVAIFGTSGVTIGTNRSSLPGMAPAGSGGIGGGSGLVGVVRHGYPNDFADPGPATLAIADTSILTAWTGINFAIVPVSLGPITNMYVSVHYQTVDGTAIAGTNYTATSGDLSFAPWATVQTIRVPIFGVVSQPKTFSVQLSSPMNAGFTTSSDTVTIDYFGDIIFRNAFD